MKLFILLLLLFAFGTVSLGQPLAFTKVEPQPSLIDVYGGSFASGDIDGDGDIDLLITGIDPGRRTALYTNDGSGTFTEVQDVPFPRASNSVTVLEDLDGDGDLDLFFSGNGFGTGVFTHIYINNGMGVFSQLDNPSLPQFQDSGVGLGDVDNDGDFDLLISVMDADNEFVADVFLNDGQANFTPTGSTTLAAVKLGKVAFIDVENDGDLDVVLSGKDESNAALTTLYLNDGVGNFSEAATSDFLSLAANDIDVADTDNDGDLDILMSGTSDQFDIRTLLYLNDGNGQFMALDTTNLQHTFAGSNAIADFDHDGDQDIVIIGSQDGGLPNIFNIVYENLGNNQFKPADTLGGEYIAACTVADFNGDQLPDIIIQGFVDKTNAYWNTTQLVSSSSDLFEEQRITIYPNPSHGRFFVHTEFASPVFLKIFDLGGNVVVAKRLNSNIEKVHMNLANGLYIAVVWTENGIESRQLIISP